MDELGLVPWDRFQTLCGIQYYLTRSSSCSADTCCTPARSGRCRRSTSRDFGRSNPFWNATATSRCSQSTSGISTPPPFAWSTRRVGAWRPATARRRNRRGGVAPDHFCTHERQRRCHGEGDPVARLVRTRPWPAHGSGTRPRSGPCGSQRDAVPHSHRRGLDQSAQQRSLEPTGEFLDFRAARELIAQKIVQRNVWQARHGGYQIHNNSVVFAGTWNKTFTRMTSMEAACESGQAVNPSSTTTSGSNQTV